MKNGTIHEIGSSGVLDKDGNILLNGRINEVNDQYRFIKDVDIFMELLSSGWRGFQLKVNNSDGSVVKAYTTGSIIQAGNLFHLIRQEILLSLGDIRLEPNGGQRLEMEIPMVNQYLIQEMRRMDRFRTRMENLDLISLFKNQKMQFILLIKVI